MQNEPWYPWFSQVCEILNAGPDPNTWSFFEEHPNGQQLALVTCKRHLSDIPSERLLRWIKSVWMSQEVISELRDLYNEEGKP